MIPVTVVGGYLGAGKTTLINAALRGADGLRLAVLVNEFGQMSIDADLIEGQDGDVVSIAGGCICCAFGDNLLGTLTEIAARDPAPDHILIEASGVAIPSAISASVGLLGAVALNATVVLADAEMVQGAAEDAYIGDTILRQLAEADLVVITKSDLVPPGYTDEVKTWLRDRAPGAGCVEAALGAVPLQVLLGPRDGALSNAPFDHADRLFQSGVIGLKGPIDTVATAERLARDTPGLVRAKGYAQDVSGSWRLIQVVGQRFEVTEAAPTASAALVCIGVAGVFDPLSLGDLE